MADSAYEFSNIPLWDSNNPKGSFVILSDDVSGRIPVTRLENWRDFTGLLENSFFNQSEIQLAFRGQRRYDWELAPSLGRLSPSGIITEALAEQQLSLFRKAIRGRISDHALLKDGEDGENDELWSIGQHHGLMTPLLDWTYSPYVALFFAFAKEDQDDETNNPYRAVYVLNKTFVADDDACPEIRIFEPRKDDYGRLVSQAGLFTFSPYDSTIENKIADILTSEDFEDDDLRNAAEDEEPGILSKYICKVYIKNEDQHECIKHLRRMNVHHGSLFPDLMGAADYCNIYITERQREKQLTDIAQNADAAGTPPTTNTPETTEEPQTHQEILSIRDLLKASAEPNSIPKNALDTISNELSKAIRKSLLIDWDERDALQAEIRNKTRVLLRKYRFPETARANVIENIISTINAEQKNVDE